MTTRNAKITKGITRDVRKGASCPQFLRNIKEAGHAAGTFVCIGKFGQISAHNSFTYLIIYFIISFPLSIVIIICTVE